MMLDISFLCLPCWLLFKRRMSLWPRDEWWWTTTSRPVLLFLFLTLRWRKWEVNRWDPTYTKPVSHTPISSHTPSEWSYKDPLLVLVLRTRREGPSWYTESPVEESVVPVTDYTVATESHPHWLRLPGLYQGRVGVGLHPNLLDL